MAAPEFRHVVIDTNAFISGDVSALRGRAEQHWAVSAVLTEALDARARAVLASLPFELKRRVPAEESIAAVRVFAAATGDLRALSRPDILLLALAHQLEREANGDTFLRAKPPTIVTAVDAPRGAARKLAAAANAESAGPCRFYQSDGGCRNGDACRFRHDSAVEKDAAVVGGGDASAPAAAAAAPPAGGDGARVGGLAGWGEGEDDEGEWLGPVDPSDAAVVSTVESSDRGERDVTQWTSDAATTTAPTHPSASAPPVSPPRVNVGILTSDFAMQNVALQLGLQLLTHSGKIVSSVKSWVLKCDACFSIFPMAGLRPEHTIFCARCGNDTLARLGVTLGPDGCPRYHYKRFRQLSPRGGTYAIPAPRGGRMHGGRSGMGGGGDLLLRADQLLSGGWKEKLRHASRADRDALMAEHAGGDDDATGGGSSVRGWGSAWAAPSGAAPPLDITPGFGRRNRNAGGRARK